MNGPSGTWSLDCEGYSTLSLGNKCHHARMWRNESESQNFDAYLNGKAMLAFPSLSHFLEQRCVASLQKKINSVKNKPRHRLKVRDFKPFGEENCQRCQQELIELCQDDCCWSGHFWTCSRETVRALHYGGFRSDHPRKSPLVKHRHIDNSWGCLGIWMGEDFSPSHS